MAKLKHRRLLLIFVCAAGVALLYYRTKFSSKLQPNDDTLPRHTSARNEPAHTSPEPGVVKAYCNHPADIVLGDEGNVSLIDLLCICCKLKF